MNPVSTKRKGKAVMNNSIDRIKNLLKLSPNIIVDTKVQLRILDTLSTNLFEYILNTTSTTYIFGSVFYFGLVLLCKPFYQVITILRETYLDGNAKLYKKILKIATCTKDIYKLELVLDIGINPNIFWDYTTSLREAIENNSKDMVNLLIEYGADSALIDTYDKTPTDYADEDMKLYLQEHECVICYEPRACIKTKCCVAKYCITCIERLIKAEHKCSMCRQSMNLFTQVNHIKIESIVIHKSARIKFWTDRL